MHRHPKLKIKVVDGSSLAVAVLLNTIPKGTTQVLLRGNLTKIAYAIAFALCHKDIQVYIYIYIYIYIPLKLKVNLAKYVKFLFN